MVQPSPVGANVTEADLDFVVGEAVPGALNKERLRQLIREDGQFRRAIVGDEKVFQRVMNDDEVFLKISPVLYFEILLHNALKELEAATHTVEQAGKQAIPVFDTEEVVELLGRPEVLDYLAQMLASFTRIQSYTVPVRVKRGILRRVRYNDMDIDSLVRFCATADESHRFSFYKRIADVCLFISGLFPGSWELRPMSVRRLPRSMEDYEREGRQFYGLAQKHPTAQALDLSEVLGLLRQHFVSARKPLTILATRYLNSRKNQLFGVQTQ